MIVTPLKHISPSTKKMYFNQRITNIKYNNEENNKCKTYITAINSIAAPVLVILSLQ